MGDGQRSARSYLLAEIGDDRTVTAEHIAETGGDELRAIRILRAQFLKEGLHINLRDTLAGTHDIGRVDGLVGGDHYEAFDAVLNGYIRHVFRA